MGDLQLTSDQLRSKTMKKFLLKRDFLGITFVLALIVLAIIAYLTGWSGGADKILVASLVFIGTIPRDILQNNQ